MTDQEEDTMFRTLKAKYQAWLDGTPAPLLKQESKPELEAGTASIAGAPNPYTRLAVIGQRAPVAVHEHRSIQPDPVSPADVFHLTTPAQRQYEAGLPEWAREALAEMDRVVGTVLREELDEVRTPQYVRRHRRNLAETMGDVLELVDESSADALFVRMLDRAKRASDPEVTGMIPVISDDMMSEEALA